ncbi:MAG TPA: hypothetical protein VMF91_23225 [Bryobacteraceae bacterium]|nr:hypothetical protein [Bryobacteraceae bacterium]
MRLVGESCLPQGTIKELTGAIASKCTASAIGAVSAGREAHNQKARERITETRHGPSPVILPAVGASLYTADLFPMRNQARTPPATYYVVMKDAQSAHESGR